MLARLALVAATTLMSFAVHATEAPRVEPPFWWTGFQEKRLQLLLHGPGLSDSEAKISARGIKLTRTTRVESPNYLFLDLEIGKRARPGSFDIVLTGPDGAKQTLAYELKARENGSASRKGFGPSDVIYLITPDRFANGDPSNDAVEGYSDAPNRADHYGRHGGDIQGIIDHLDYIEDMGFTSIWLNPVLENAMPEQSYHGYATTDYYKTDPRFGDNALYRRLSDEAKARGIGLIMDQIANHSGLHHWWMKDLPTKDWINMGGEFAPTNHYRTTIQDPYAAAIDRKHFEDGWFVSAMPDLNQRNPLLARYLIQNSIWWIEFAVLHGIRQDTYPYPNSTFMADWTKAIMREFPSFSIVGEEWSPNPLIVAYWLEGRNNPDGYTSALTSAMDFPMQITLSQALTAEESWNSGFMTLYELLVNDVLYANPQRLVTIADNHDMDRVHTQMGKDEALTRMAMAYLLTMRGTPQIYYGTEILLANETPHDHGEIREEMPGGWPDHTRNAFTGEGLSQEAKAFQSDLRTLLNWRARTPAVQTGKLKHFGPQNGTYVFFRYDDETLIMTALNKSPEPVVLDTARFAEILPASVEAKNVLTGEDLTIGETLTLPARTPLILEMAR